LFSLPLLKSLSAESLHQEKAEKAKNDFFCEFMLNTSTIRGQKLTPPQQVDVRRQGRLQRRRALAADLDRFIKRAAVSRTWPSASRTTV